MKMKLSEHLYRLAMIIHLAAFKDIVVDSWTKSSKNPDIFIKKMEPLLKRYQGSNLDTREVDQLKKDVLEGTEGRIELRKTLSKFEAVPVEAPTR